MHCITYHGQTSALQEITASIIQGSAIGRTSYIVVAADLCSITPGNCLCKYADDTYIIILVANAHSREAELDNVEEWACLNNLYLNHTKSVEIVLMSSRQTRRAVSLQPSLPDMARVLSLKILVLTVSDSLSVCDHMQYVISSCEQTAHSVTAPCAWTV